MTKKVLAGFVLWAQFSSGQTVFEKVYGDQSYMESGSAVMVTADSGFILTGTNFIYMPPCPNGCFGSAYLLKVNSLGDTVFAKTFDATSRGFSLVETMDGGYAIGAVKEDGIDQGNMLIKTNPAGDTAWTKIYADGGYLVVQTPDSGFFLAGNSLLKLNSSGDSLWTKDLGLAFSMIVTSIDLTADSGLVISGYLQSNGEIIVIKTNSSGDTLWTKNYGSGSGRSVRQLNDGSFILAAGKTDTSTFDGFINLMKLDAPGDTLWTKEIRGTHTLEARDLIQCRDGGFVISGNTYDFNTNEGDLLLIKTDSAGNVEWENTYSHNYNDMGLSVKQTPEGGFIVAGTTSNVVTSWESDIYLVKTDSLGNSLLNRTSEQNFPGLILNIRPNPTNGQLVFSVPVVEGHIASIHQIEIINTLGKRVQYKRMDSDTSDKKEIQIDLTGLPSGIYFLQATSGEKVLRGKVVKE